MLTVQIDVDGVLADFVKAYLHTAEVFYPGCSKDYATEKQETFGHYQGFNLWDNRVWDLLRDTPWWWTSLEPMVFADEFQRIAALCRSARVYFVTNRMHNHQSPVEQTAAWLRRSGIPHPSVILASDKGAMAAVLKTDYSIEDKFENAFAVYNSRRKAQSYLLDRRYNRDELFPHPYPAALRVQTVAQFLDIVEGEIADAD